MSDPTTPGSPAAAAPVPQSPTLPLWCQNDAVVPGQPNSLLHYSLSSSKTLAWVPSGK